MLTRLARASVVASSGGRGVGGVGITNPLGGGGGDARARRNTKRINCFRCSRCRLRRRLETLPAPVSSSHKIAPPAPLHTSAIVNAFSLRAKPNPLARTLANQRGR